MSNQDEVVISISKDHATIYIHNYVSDTPLLNLESNVYLSKEIQGDCIENQDHIVEYTIKRQSDILPVTIINGKREYKGFILNITDTSVSIKDENGSVITTSYDTIIYPANYDYSSCKVVNSQFNSASDKDTYYLSFDNNKLQCSYILNLTVTTDSTDNLNLDGLPVPYNMKIEYMVNIVSDYSIPIMGRLYTVAYSETNDDHESYQQRMVSRSPSRSQSMSMVSSSPSPRSISNELNNIKHPVYELGPHVIDRNKTIHIRNDSVKCYFIPYLPLLQYTNAGHLNEGVLFYMPFYSSSCNMNLLLQFETTNKYSRYLLRAHQKDEYINIFLNKSTTMRYTSIVDTKRNVDKSVDEYSIKLNVVNSGTLYSTTHIIIDIPQQDNMSIPVITGALKCDLIGNNSEGDVKHYYIQYKGDSCDILIEYTIGYINYDHS